MTNRSRASIDFFRFADALNGKTVAETFAIRITKAIGYDAAYVRVSGGYARLTVNPDTDEIELSFLRRKPAIPADRIDRSPLSRMLGKRLGWCWTCHNSQGYRDTVMLSVSGVFPDFIFHGIASRLLIKRVRLAFRVEQARRQSNSSEDK